MLALEKYKAKAFLVGGIILIWLSSVMASYYIGKANQRAEDGQKVSEVLKDELDKSEKESAERAAKTEKVATEVAMLRNRLAKAREESNRAIDANENRGSAACELSADELRTIQAIIDSYR